MGPILSIETATKICSVALHDEGQLIACSTLSIEKSHAEAIMAMIDHVLEVAHCQRSALSAIAISSGPGSYTGLRVGTSTAKGLCFALNIPLIAVNTLESMAHHVRQYLPQEQEFLLCPMIDARRMEVYCLLTDQSLSILEPTHAKIIDEESVQPWFEKHPTIYFFGDGAMKCKPVLAPYPNVTILEKTFASTHSLGIIAYQKALESEFEDLPYFEPFYLKPFQTKKSTKNSN